MALTQSDLEAREGEISAFMAKFNTTSAMEAWIAAAVFCEPKATTMDEASIRFAALRTKKAFWKQMTLEERVWATRIAVNVYRQIFGIEPKTIAPFSRRIPTI